MEERKEYKPLSFAKGSLISTIIGIIQAVILVGVGVVCIACSKMDWLRQGIFLAVGIIVTLFGILKLVMNAIPVFKAKSLSDEDKILFKGYFETDMIMTGAIELIIGILLIVLYAINKDLLGNLMAFIGYAIAIALFVVAGTLMIFATGFLVSRIYKVFAAVIYYFFSAVLIGLGVLICVFLSQNSDFTIVVLISAGIVLCCIGLVILGITIKDAVVAKKEKKEKEDKAPVQVEAVEVKVVDVEDKNEIVKK